MIELVAGGFNIVLYRPEIPANTGNIGRLCVGTGSTLHLIKPFRFLMDEKSLRRAGLDYWHLLDLQIHNEIGDIFQSYQSDRIFLCTTKTSQSYLQREYKQGDVFVFGPESSGLPVSMLEECSDQCIGIPMCPSIRSINLANSVAIILYEALRQINIASG
jgi:tRNA (cytidine/uridine-2'-O-)-methyltransferase